MHTLKLMRRAIIHLIKQAWLLPQSVAIAVKQRRRQRGRPYFFKNAENKSIGSGRKVVVLCSLAISRIVWR